MRLARITTLFLGSVVSRRVVAEASRRSRTHLSSGRRRE